LLAKAAVVVFYDLGSRARERVMPFSAGGDGVRKLPEHQARNPRSRLPQLDTRLAASARGSERRSLRRSVAGRTGLEPPGAWKDARSLSWRSITVARLRDSPLLRDATYADVMGITKGRKPTAEAVLRRLRRQAPRRRPSPGRPQPSPRYGLNARIKGVTAIAPVL